MQRMAQDNFEESITGQFAEELDIQEQEEKIMVAR